MSGTGSNRALALVLAALLAGACASGSQSDLPLLQRNMTMEEVEAQLARLSARAAALRKQEIAKEEAELLDLIATSNLLAMPEAERGELRGATMGKVAELRLEARDIEGASEAVVLALESAGYAEDPTLVAQLRALQVLILHYGALDAARAKDYKKSLAYFDRAMGLPALSAEQRRVLGGDRLVVMEAEGQGAGENMQVTAALNRLFGPPEPPPAPAPSPSPTQAPTALAATPALPPLPTAQQPTPSKPVTQRRGVPDGLELNPDKIRAAINREIGSDVAESRLPSAGKDVPMETGKFDSASVVRVVSANKASISACYSQALRGGTTQRGKLELLVKVEPSGAVQSARIVTQQFKSSPLGRCIADTVARWRFPPFQGEARDVELPFVLDYLN